ncbi:hypothetical protein PMIN01_08831 [Paraphaeosphaeria minitans]|uniref:Uncharacterized protein n=1 Tax=Paraphaeosphaeria minitans TaxID=565426 RepID=A0A9P6KN29_9PLEO|nr:hypothetical protein PMIN01_08831 [Paraphaeosphaeria minitans]
MRTVSVAAARQPHVDAPHRTAPQLHSTAPYRTAHSMARPQPHAGPLPTAAHPHQ